MAYSRPLLPYPLVDGTYVDTLPRITIKANPSVEELPNYLSNYAQLTTWESVCLEEVLQNNSPLPAKNIYLKSTVTRMQDPNLVFEKVRSRLAPQHYFVFSLITAENVKFSINSEFNTLIFTLYYPFYFLVKRVLPKLTGLRRICRLLTIIPDISKAEIMGRLIYKGFSVIDIREETRETTLIVKPNFASDPSQTRPIPSQGFILRMQRLGQYSKPIQVYKLRTMHPYAEYVQAYLHERNGLDRGGKFKNDFRVIKGGRVIRKYWLDEIPMLYNLLRGDLKLIGIRPISEHYFSLYPASAQVIRTRHKPGLLPPFYADLPQTFDEIVQSELTYLTAYEAAPFATDLRYFKRILMNIFFNKARSK
ncbi:sugar transferase [Spirosoma validum]|uniref:Sugar transferase n=1 Tax=Spirosoma validum TaxID=2771355 RepID=A0A927GCD7_9BACT|nr:sugar transferase [Spirosoma validum]MBD2752559.1 sugar transferase [Spirosoma validum]